MSAVTHTRVPNRLQQLLSAPGGVTVATALKDAQTNLANVAPALLDAVDSGLLALRTAAQAAVATGSPPDGGSGIYRLASEVAGLAGLCGQARIGEVAYSLCELTDRYISAESWNVAAVAAHIDLMTLLRTADLPEGSAEAAAILDGLKVLVRRAEAPLRLIED